jgi:hypothetical protein
MLTPQTFLKTFVIRPLSSFLSLLSALLTSNTFSIGYVHYLLNTMKPEKRPSLLLWRCILLTPDISFWTSISICRDLGCGLTSLTILKVSMCGLQSLDGTFGLTSLRELHASNNMVDDVGPCSSLPHIRIIDLRK